MFLYIGILLISLNINAQESVSIHWPLTSGDAGFLTSPGADVAFAPGRSVSVVTFDQAHGAGSIGWAARERSNDAYYEYRIAPQAGYTFRLVQLNVEISMSRGELKVAAYASTNGYRSPSSPIGLPRLAATTSPRNLSLPADISVSYPDTLSIRIYAWGARDQQVSFYNRHVRLEGLTTVDSTMLATVQPEVTEKREEIPPAMTEPGKTPDSLQLAASAIHASDSIDARALNPETDALQADANKPLAESNIEKGDNNTNPKGSEPPYITPGTYTWTCPPGVTQVTVECWGGGGAGGGNTSYQNGAGGGGGGGYSRAVLAVTPGNSYTVTVGAAGAAGTGNGGSGGNSWFNTSGTVLARGGAGGNAPSGGNAGTGGNGGAIGIGNQATYTGGNGGTGFYNNYGTGGGGGSSAGTDANGINGNNGGSTPGTGGTAPTGGGNGGKGGDHANDGNSGYSPGGGGGGSGDRTNQSGNLTGGAGAGGQVIISWPDCINPIAYNVTGGGSYCTGGNGLPVGVDNSESDVTYQLFRGATALTTINGTGNAISFGNQTVAGTYTVVATRATCTTNMNGSASITVLTIPAQPSAITGTTSPCQGTSQTYSVTNVAGNTYTWTFPTGWTQTAGGTSNSVTVTVGSSNGTITVTPSNACGTGSAGTLSVTTSTTPAQPSDITGNTSPCQGTSQTYSVTNVAGVTYTWTFPTGWTQTAGGTSNSVTVTVGTGNGNIMVTPSNACGNGTSRTLAVTTTTTPAQPSAIAGNNLPCQGSTQTYSVTNVSGVTYTWTVPAGWSINSGQGSNSVVVSVGAASGNISVTPSNSCGNGTAQSLAVTIQSLPVQTSPINPVTTQVCQNSVHNFSVMPPPPAGFTYNWAGPAGSTILSGQGTNIIQIRFGNQSGNLSITPHNSCGDGPAQTMAINVSTSTPAIPGAITGVAAPCIGSSKTYNIPDLGYIYTWTVPAGWIIVSGQGSSSINVTVGATAGNISVTAGNACGGSAARTLTVTPQASAPAQPSAITGNSPVCAGSTQTYAVTNVPFVVYTWSTPAGWTLTAGQGTNSVTYTVGATSGTITVTPSNDCGTGIAGSRNIVVDVAPPANTSAIAGLNNPCQNSSQTYSVTNVSGVTYTWAVPADWAINAGQGTNLIAVTVGSVNGNITVVPSNGCGNGATSTLPVTVFLLPATAGTISGDILFCEGTEHTYSVTPVSGITYDWTVPAGWSIISGQGTNSINITAGVNSGNVQVTPQNDCGNGPPSLLAVTVNPLPAAETGPDGAICVGDDIQIGAPPVAGNTYLWTPDPLGEVFDFTVSNPVVEPNVNTTYTLVETNTSTGCSNTNSVIILANQIIAVTVVPLEQTMCSGSTTNFVISSNISGTIFTWEPNLDVGNAATTTGYSSGSGPLIHQTITNVSSAASTISYFIKAIADECENTNLSAVVYINPEPVSDNQTPAAICSDIASGVNFAASTNGLSIASYNILSINNNGLSASSGNPQTGNGFSANEIADDAWTNLTTAPVNVVYTVQGVSNSGCAGNQFTVTLVINPEPMVTNPATNEICSGASTNINLTANIPSTFTWTIGTITGGITGAAPGSGNTINQTLINPDNATPGTVDYIVTPTASTGSCAGAPFTITVTVYPNPVVTNAPTKRICSGTSTNISLTSSTPSNFTWTTGAITGGITGASGGTGSTINQVLTNPSNATSGTVEYLVTSTSTSGGCAGAPFTITVTVDPIPTVNAWAVPTEICPGEEFDLSSSSSLTWAPEVLLSEGFEGSDPPAGWSKTNSSTGGNPANAAWTIRNEGYLGISSNTDNHFYFSNSDAQGAGSYTDTYLVSASFNTMGYTTLSLDFYHYYRSYPNSYGEVQISTDGINWTTIDTYINTQPGATNFSHRTLDISSYAEFANVRVRFHFNAYWGYYWAIDNVSVIGTSDNAIPIISWSSTPAGFTSSEPIIQNLTQAQTTTYTVSYTNPLSLCSADASITVIDKPLPDAEIIADYCSTPGCIELTATGGGTYLWNTVPPSTQQTICVDEAGIYSVTVTGTNGCVETAFLSAASELVVDGSFTNFNAGSPSFFSEYIQHQAYWNQAIGLWTPSGLHPENLYAVNTNAWTNYPNLPQGYHPNFHGRDHTNNTVGPRNFMMLNGGTDYIGTPPHRRIIWQQTVAISENLNYYFSAWGMNLNPDSPARLQFEIVTPQNGAEQVGSIADLNIAEKPTNEGMVGLSNWVRFYSTPFWTAPAGATTAIIRIINLNTDPGGNDFGLDDISFGTLDPIPFDIDPAVVGHSSNIVCEGEDIELTPNIDDGGLPPFYFEWSGPNGFNSTQQNPIITDVTLADAGIYTIEVSDSYGCDPVFRTFEIFVNPAPTASISGGGDYCQFAASPFIYFTGTVGTPPFTFEYNINGGATETVSTWGTDITTFVFAPTNISGTFVYNLTGVTDANGCSNTLSASATVVIHALPSAFITGDWVVCPLSLNTYTGNTGMNGYDWSITGNGSISGVANQQNVDVTAGDECSISYNLMLMVTDNNGCNATAEEVIMVEDTQAPVLTVPSTGLALGCNPASLPSEASVSAASTATDNCGTPTITAVAGAVTGTCDKSQTFTVTAADACNNTDVETVTYTWTDDAVPPVLTVPSTGLALGCNPASLPSEASVTAASTATDNCGTPTITAVAGAVTGTCDKSQTFTVTATDACNNTDVETVTYTWTDDVVPPSINCAPGAITVPADAGETFASNVTVPTPATSDNCSTPTLSWSAPGATPASGTSPFPATNQFPVGTTTITWTASDGCGNVATCTFTVTVNPNAPPEIECELSGTFDTDEGDCSATFVPGYPSLISGAEPIDWTYSITNEAGDEIGNGTCTTPTLPTCLGLFTFPVGVNTITWTANNASGTATCTQDIVIEDHQPPTFTTPGPFDFCVIDIFSALYDGQPGPDADIMPEPLYLPQFPAGYTRPDWYIINSGNTVLDLPAISDNCCLPTDAISWIIHFDPIVGQPDINGTRQPSLSTPIKLWGTPTNVFVTHTITYTVTDCNGNAFESDPVNIIIKPRPDVDKN